MSACRILRGYIHRSVLRCARISFIKSGEHEVWGTEQKLPANPWMEWDNAAEAKTHIERLL